MDPRLHYAGVYWIVIFPSFLCPFPVFVFGIRFRGGGLYYDVSNSKQLFFHTCVYKCVCLGVGEVLYTRVYKCVFSRKDRVGSIRHQGLAGVCKCLVVCLPTRKQPGKGESFLPTLRLYNRLLFKILPLSLSLSLTFSFFLFFFVSPPNPRFSHPLSFFHFIMRSLVSFHSTL